MKNTRNTLLVKELIHRGIKPANAWRIVNQSSGAASRALVGVLREYLVLAERHGIKPATTSNHKGVSSWFYSELCNKYTDEISSQVVGISFRGDKYGNHLDHIVPKCYGFKHNIPIERICSVENLRVVSARENIEKGQKITDQAKLLLAKWGFPYKE